MKIKMSSILMLLILLSCSSAKNKENENKEDNKKYINVMIEDYVCKMEIVNKEDESLVILKGINIERSNIALFKIEDKDKTVYSGFALSESDYNSLIAISKIKGITTLDLLKEITNIQDPIKIYNSPNVPGVINLEDGSLAFKTLPGLTLENFKSIQLIKIPLKNIQNKIKLVNTQVKDSFATTKDFVIKLKEFIKTESE